MRLLGKAFAMARRRNLGHVTTRRPIVQLVKLLANRFHLKHTSAAPASESQAYYQEFEHSPSRPAGIDDVQRRSHSKAMRPRYKSNRPDSGLCSPGPMTTESGSCAPPGMRIPSVRRSIAYGFTPIRTTLAGKPPCTNVSTSASACHEVTNSANGKSGPDSAKN